MDTVALPIQAFITDDLSKRAEILLAHLAHSRANVRRGWLLLTDAEERTRRLVATFSVSAEEGMPLNAVRVLEDACIERTPRLAWQEPNACWIGIPLLLGERCIGGVVLEQDAAAPQSEPLNLLERAAIACASLLANERSASAERETQQQERLRMIGERAVRVAHELNSPLTNLLGYTETLAQTDWRNPFLRDRIAERLQIIEREAQRAAGIARNLLSVAPTQTPSKNNVSLNQLLAETVALFQERFQSEGVALIWEGAAEEGVVAGSYVELQQVLANLITNAFQAIQEQRRGGRITLTLRRSEEGAGWEVAVTDDGPGIPAELKTRLCDPFFTTKSSGRNAGLGLAICRDILTQHQATMEIASEVGKGAQFILRFPPAPARSTPASPAFLSLASDALPELHIAILDDEPLVREMLVENLTEQGHRVQCFESPHVALQALQQRRFDLLLCDIRMPVMNGIEFYRTLRERNPDLAERVIFLTGDTLAPVTHEFLVETERPYLAKPFRQCELRACMEQTLRETGYQPRRIQRVQAA